MVKSQVETFSSALDSILQKDVQERIADTVKNCASDPDYNLNDEYSLYNSCIKILTEIKSDIQILSKLPENKSKLLRESFGQFNRVYQLIVGYKLSSGQTILQPIKRS